MLHNTTTIDRSEISDEQIKFLNKKYKLLSATNRIKELYKDFDVSEVMLTSSFAATSAFLLKILSTPKPSSLGIMTSQRIKSKLEKEARLDKANA